MKPQTEAYLKKSRELLDHAETMLRVDLNDEAGRTAYLAGFHAAQALIFERHGRVFKTHAGVHSEFARLVKDDSRIDSELRAFLGLTFQLKLIADYECGPDSHVSAENASRAIWTARRFMESVTALIPLKPPSDGRT